MNQEIEVDMVNVLFFEEKMGIGEEREGKPLKKFLRQHKRHLEVLILISLLLIGILCGYIGFFNRLALEFNSQNFLKVTYHILQLFALQFNVDPPIPWALEIARFLCPIALYISATLAILRLFHDTIKLILLVVRKHHIVICGLDKRVMELVDDFSSEREKVVIIEKDKNNENITKAKDLDATVIFGDYTDPFILKKARVHRAKYMIAFTPNDYVNIEIANGVNNLLKKKREDFKCFIHIKDPNLSASKFLPEPQFQVRAFNAYENSARFLFLSNKVNPILETWLKGGQVHLLIIGFREMGENIVLRAANLGRYPNGKKIKFTVVDEDIKRLRNNFFYRYRNIKEIDDIINTVKYKPGEKLQENLRKFGNLWEQIWETIPFQGFNFKAIPTKDFLKFERFIKEVIKDQNITAIFVCFEDKSLAIQYKDCLISILESDKIPIYVQIDDNEKIIELPEKNNIYPFGLIKNSCSREFIVTETLDELAKKIHENFVKEFKDMPKWEDLSDFFKNSNRFQADHNLIKLKKINCGIVRKKNPKDFEFAHDEIETLARMEHNRWCAEKIIYKKDLVENPPPDLLKSFDDLSARDKEKDYNSIRKMSEFLKPEIEIQKLSTIYYNKARLESKGRNRKEAIKFLKRAIDLDKNYINSAKTDKVFDYIRDLKEFKELIGEYFY